MKAKTTDHPPPGCAVCDPSLDAFSQSVQPWLCDMHAAARRIVRCHDLAWDAVQTALVRLWRRSDQTGAPRRLFVYSARRAGLEILRARSRRSRHELRAATAGTHHRAPTDPSEAIEQADAPERLRELLRPLPEECREAVVLRVERELSYSEIAGRLEIPVGTVRSRLHRARLALAAAGAA